MPKTQPVPDLVTEQTFTNSSVFIDGMRFVRCRFLNVQLIYEARDWVDFEDCAFENCTWTFDGAAERMINFLSMIQEQIKPDGAELVEGIFKSIRSRKIASIQMSAQFGFKADPEVIEGTATS